MPPDPRSSHRSDPAKGSKRELQDDERPELPPGVASRNAALDLLRMTTRGMTLDQALGECRSFGALEGSDRAFARALASTTLRRRGTLDEVIATYLREPLKPKQTHLQDILRITAAQLCLMGTEAHAAAWSAVELAKLRVETRGYQGLVNAVARRLAETGAKKAEGAELRADTPGWLWRQLARAYGAKTASAIARAHQSEAPLDLTAKDRDGFAKSLGDRTFQAIGPQTIRMDSTQVRALPGFEDGTFWVQDVAATLPATVLAAQPGERVFDLCAAPGGKTMQLAATGADVFAVDHSGPRIERLRENLERTKLSAALLEDDILKWNPPQKADAVLLDAPCSATGTIRRNPDLLWTSRETQVPDLVRLQAKMIDQALNLVQPGGRLVYAVCSLLKDEGENQITEALKRHEGLQRLPITEDEVAGLPVITKDGDVRSLPHRLADRGGMDGFFVARLKKAG